MKKQGLFVMLIIIINISCNSSNDFNKVFNHFIISQSKLEMGTYPGVKQILEIHHFDSLTIYGKKHLLFFKMFDPKIKYRAKINDNGLVEEYGNYEGYLFRVKYKYAENEQIKSISGYLPYPINIILEYDKNSAIGSIFREGGENNLFEYSNNNQLVICYQFELGDVKEGKSLKKGELLRKYSIEKSENEEFIIKEIDAKTNNELNVFTYKDFKLVKQKSLDGKIVGYEYDSFENVTKVNYQSPDNSLEIYTFKYEFDTEDNWIKRTILLNDIQILSSERKITYN